MSSHECRQKTACFQKEDLDGVDDCLREFKKIFASVRAH
jgi:hypothetical protein